VYELLSEFIPKHSAKCLSLLKKLIQEADTNNVRINVSAELIRLKDANNGKAENSC